MKNKRIRLLITMSVLVILSGIFFACDDSKKEFFEKLEVSLKESILGDNSNLINKHNFIENELKLMYDARKIFIEKIKIEEKVNISLIEFFNLSKEKLYKAIIRQGDNVHFFEYKINSEYNYELIEYNNFKKKYPVMNCVMNKSENKIGDLLVSKPNNSFHAKVFIAKIKSNTINTYIAKSLCL